MSFRACPYFEKSDFMLGKYLEKVRENAPIIHNITNYVTVNDVANIILACGASPIMSDEPEDAAEITGLCGGSLTSISARLTSVPFRECSRPAKEPRSCPTFLCSTLWGGGASKLRTDTAVGLLNELKFTAVRETFPK